MQGWIKDYRKEINSDIWLMPPLYHRIWQYLKYQANHKDNRIPMQDGSFLNIKAGQHLTSVRNIAKGVGWYEGLQWKEPNPRTVTKIIEWLEKQQMIKIDRGRGNRQYTLVTVSNWALYQNGSEGGNSKTTASTSGSKQPVHINNNEKNEENEKNNHIHDLFDHYLSKNIIKHKKITDSMKSEINARLKDYSFEDLKKAIDNYAVVYSSDDYWFTHKYPLADFMKDKGIRNFIDEADPLNNYKKDKSEKDIKQQHDPRDKEIELQRWIQDGNDPNEFDWSN